MKKYYDPENTPLKFHKFFIYFLIPVALVTNVALIFSNISKVSVWNLTDLRVLDMVFNTLNMVYLVFMFNGLSNMKAYGWILVIIFTVGSIILSFFNMVTYFPNYPELFGAEIPSFILMLLSSGYYAKRKALFFKGSREKHPPMNVQPIGALNINNYHENQQIIEPIEIEAAEEVRNQDEVANQIIQPGRKFRVQSLIFNWVIIIALVISVVFAIINQRAAATARAEAIALKGEIQVKDSEMATLKSTIDSRKRDIAVLQSKVVSLESDVSWFTEKSSSDSEKLSFMDSHVVIVADDGSKLYHKYGCSRLNLSYFWIYNSEAAWDKGYRPCSYCN